MKIWPTLLTWIAPARGGALQRGYVRQWLHRVSTHLTSSLKVIAITAIITHAGQQLLHLEVLAPGRDLMADAVARGVHFGEDDAGEVEDHRDPQRFQQHRKHARQIDAERGLHGVAP